MVAGRLAQCACGPTGELGDLGGDVSRLAEGGAPGVHEHVKEMSVTAGVEGLWGRAGSDVYGKA